MGRKYNNPPIIEALCEFKLPTDSKWDLTIPGLLYEKLSRDFPVKEQRVVQGVETTNSGQGLQQHIHSSERVLFLAEDRKSLIQVGPQLLTINCLKPYPGWEFFKPKIEKAYQEFNDITETKTLERIGLRYINHIQFPTEALNLDDYFEFRPTLGQTLPQNMTDFIVGCLLPFNDERDICKIKLTNIKSEKVTIVLDLDYYLQSPQSILSDNAIEWVDEAHKHIEDVFEGCISDSLRAIFQGVR